jgi:type IV secretory pathway TraG/TraD family ATPase VirD4
MAIIDPHGDLCDTILNYIPARRINDVVYFNPADREYTVNLNPLEVKNQEESELVVSGIVAIFNKLYGHSWGPRLEYILRNTLLALVEIPGSTLGDVVKMLTDKKFRQTTVNKLQDNVIKAYWVEEFEKMNDRLRTDSISPILNKVGQFVSSPSIRSIIGQQRSSIDLDDIMNNGKILIVNLSQGKLGEDNAALLGAMLITKLQLSAMRRVNIPEDQRKDFYLYVDEFQNFATTSFIKILSEARKYRLNLMMANQYMAQIPEEITKAILGNAGTLITFTIGADDASVVKREYSEVFSENDLVGLTNYQIAIKLMVDAHATRPFLATTLPLPQSSNLNREKVIKVSRERYAKKN